MEMKNGNCFRQYLKQQIAEQYPDYLSKHTENVAYIAEKLIKQGQTRLFSKYVIQFEKIWQGYYKLLIWTAGLLHDIFEDTDCTELKLHKIIEQSIDYANISVEHNFIEDIISCVKKVTYNKTKETYEEYVNQIIKDYLQEKKKELDIYAYIVKKADYADHFQQYETLTPKLIEKYKPFVHFFLIE